MSQFPRTPIPDRPEPVALGRRAALGALVCAIVLTGCTWAVGKRIWQMLQPATINWDEVPIAVELPPDQVHAVARGKTDPGALLDSVYGEPASGPRTASRLDEERRLLAEMFPQVASSRNGSGPKDPRLAQAVRPFPPARFSNAGETISNVEIPAPASSGSPMVSGETVKSQSNSFAARKPWSATGMEPPENTSPEKKPTDPGLEFPTKFSGHGTVLPTAVMHVPATSPNNGSSQPGPAEQVQATSPIANLANTLAESVQKLQSQPALDSAAESPATEPVAKSGRPPGDSEADQRLVTVEPGDSYWTISQRVYGDGNWFQAIYFENREQIGSFEELAEGMQLRCPSTAVLKAKFPNLSPATAVEIAGGSESGTGDRVYRTMAGDTLFGVARQQLGQASRYLEIAELNQTVLGQSIGHLDPLPEGLKIVLPNIVR